MRWTWNFTLYCLRLCPYTPSTCDAKLFSSCVMVLLVMVMTVVMVVVMVMLKVMVVVGSEGDGDDGMGLFIVWLCCSVKDDDTSDTSDIIASIGVTHDRVVCCDNDNVN